MHIVYGRAGGGMGPVQDEGEAGKQRDDLKPVRGVLNHHPASLQRGKSPHGCFGPNLIFKSYIPVMQTHSGTQAFALPQSPALADGPRCPRRPTRLSHGRLLTLHTLPHGSCSPSRRVNRGGRDSLPMAAAHHPCSAHGVSLRGALADARCLAALAAQGRS